MLSHFSPKLPRIRIPGQHKAREIALGVDLDANHASVVAAVRHRSKTEIVLAARVENGAELDSVLRKAGIATRDAISCLHATKIRHGSLPSGEQLPAKLRLGAAANYAEDLIPNVPDGDASVARLVVNRDSGSTIIAALKSDIDSLATRMKAMNLNLVALDSPAMAWLRIAPQGVFDVDSGFIAVPTPTGVAAQHAQVAPSPAQYAANVTQAFTTLRQNRYNGSIVSLRSPLNATLEKELNLRLGGSPTMEPLVIENEQFPPWALAYALCLWSVT